MKAVRVHELGGPEMLCYEDVSEPRPKTGEALVKIEAAGFQILDVKTRGGWSEWRARHHSR